MPSSPKPTLRVDWCSHEAAKYAVEHWHYSQAMPAGKLVRVGAWEDGQFIGCVLFGRGANRRAAAMYGLRVECAAELVRVALTSHATPVTRIVAIAIRFLARQSPGLRLLFSYADPEHGHHGGIYQGGGWTYVGRSTPQAEIEFRDGTRMHKRSVTAKYGHASAAALGAKWVTTATKHKYLMPLDDEMRAKVAALAKPYPKRPACSVVDSPAVPPSEGVRPDQHAPHQQPPRGQTHAAEGRTSRAKSTGKAGTGARS